MVTYLRQVQRLRMTGVDVFITECLLMTCMGTTLIYFTARIYISTFCNYPSNCLR